MRSACMLADIETVTLQEIKANKSLGRYKPDHNLSKYHALQCLTTLTMASLTNSCIVVGTTLDVEETEHWY